MGLITSIILIASAAVAGKKVSDNIIDKKTKSKKDILQLEHKNEMEKRNAKQKHLMESKAIDTANTKDVMFSKHMQEKDIRILDYKLSHNIEVDDLKNCNYCGASNVKEARFCYNCGKEIMAKSLRVSKYCIGCGHPLHGEKGFLIKCDHCGNEQIL